MTRRYAFVLDLNLAESMVYMIFVEDLPSLLALMPGIGAITSWGILGGLHYTIDQFCRRGFRALHGHSLDDACPRCDPHTHKLWQEAAQKRREEKARATSGKGTGELE